MGGKGRSYTHGIKLHKLLLYPGQTYGVKLPTEAKNLRASADIAGCLLYQHGELHSREQILTQQQRANHVTILFGELGVGFWTPQEELYTVVDAPDKLAFGAPAVTPPPRIVTVKRLRIEVCKRPGADPKPPLSAIIKRYPSVSKNNTVVLRLQSVRALWTTERNNVWVTNFANSTRGQ